jgi:CDP-4-dehydro-6-deoxyglucose reductase
MDADSVSHTVTLHGSGKRFVVAPGETVLDAARRAGLALPYSCLGGLCGSCKATVLAGDCSYPNQPPQALTEAERAQHQVLLCQAVPRSDLVIVAREVPSVADLPRRVLALKLTEKTLLAPDVVRLTLKPPRGERLRWLAGQYLDVLLPGGRRRAFSIANAPEDADHVELHIRHVEGGGFTHHVFADLAVGAILRVEGPLGTFVPREDSERAMLLVAGGTGFAPIKALIEHFLHLGTSRPMHFYWGVRAERDLYLPALPAVWAARHPAFYVTTVLSEPADGEARRHRTGFVHEVVLADFLDLSEFDVYMSGPPPMIEAGRRGFVQAGLPEERLYYDSFEYAPDVLAAILAARAGVRGA